MGDDVRHIDWNVTARMDEMFVRQYVEDRELTGWLLLDHSRSMGFGPVQRTKERVLCEVAATTAQLLPVQADGFNVATALDRELLEEVADITDGSYHEGDDAAGLAAVSETIDLRFRVVSERTEVTGLSAAAGIVLLIVGALLSVLWFGRLSEMTFTRPLAMLLILAVPLVLGVYLLAMRRRRKQAMSYSSVALLRSVLPTRSRWQRHLPIALLLSSIGASAWRRPGRR